MRQLMAKFIQNLHITVCSEGGRVCVNAYIADLSVNYKVDLSKLLEGKITEDNWFDWHGKVERKIDNNTNIMGVYSDVIRYADSLYGTWFSWSTQIIHI